MRIKRNNDKRIELDLNPIYSKEEDNCLINASLIYSKSNGDSIINLGGYSVVEGDSIFSGGLVSKVLGDTKVNISLKSSIKESAGVNLGIFSKIGYGSSLNLNLAYSGTGYLRDYSLEDVCPRIMNHLPRWIKKISLPGISAGIVTNTQSAYNGAIFGIFNNISLDDTSGDYLAFGLLNRVKNGKRKALLIPFITGKVSIDGIFSHKKG